MTNEEKAQSIVCFHCNQQSCDGPQTVKSCPKNKEVNNLLEMAQWKDEQLSKCLENLEKEYIRNSGKGLYNNNEIAAKLATLKRIEEEMSKIHNQN